MQSPLSVERGLSCTINPNSIYNQPKTYTIWQLNICKISKLYSIITSGVYKFWRFKLENTQVNSSDYCLNCGTALLYPSMPCPKCQNKSKINYKDINPKINLVTRKETIYFVISLLISILLYASWGVFIYLRPQLLLYIIFFALYTLFSHGLLIGHLKGNAIKVTSAQFPEVYSIAQDLSTKMGLKKAPEIYVLQAGGCLNAFATRFAGRDFAVIYSDVLELAYKQGESALEFIICHEFAHLKNKHIQKKLWLLPASFIPFLGSAYSRACEYTCDRFGAYFQPEGAIKGLLVLAAGKELYTLVNIQEYIKQAEHDSGFWSWLAEIFATHPHLYKRLHKVSLQ